MKFRCNTAGEQTTPTDFKRLWKPVFKHQILNVVILPETQFWIIDWFGALAINVPWKYWIWKLCLSFAKKKLKSDKFASWFSFNTNNYDKTRSEKDILTLVKTRTNKYKKSPVPYLTTILNDHLKGKDRQKKSKT